MKKTFWIIGIAIVMTGILVSVGFSVSPGSQKAAPQIGRPAPDFSLKSIEGDKLDLKSVIGKNKVTILNFWATWCPPCRAEIPEFVEFAEKYQSERVALVAVNIQEEPKQVSSFVQKAGMNFPVLLDQSGKVAQVYQIYAIPTTFFIDDSGVIREKIEGSLNLSRMESIYRKLIKD